jgi:HPt (histidine-containing phosphotransfer) domain-containing protein
MDGFVAKPIQTEDLWETIDRVVGAPAPTIDGPIPPLVDPRVLLAACGEDADILKSICDTLRARLPDHLIAVQDALRERDAARLREAAHKLFGMISAFSTLAGDTASDLEDLAAQGRLEEAQPLVRELETMVPQLLELTNGISIDFLRAS